MPLPARTARELPCPTWCARPHGHDLALCADGVVRRWHVSAPRVCGAEVEVFETVGLDGVAHLGTVALRTPRRAVPLGDAHGTEVALAAVLA